MVQGAVYAPGHCYGVPTPCTWLFHPVWNRTTALHARTNQCPYIMWVHVWVSGVLRHNRTNQDGCAHAPRGGGMNQTKSRQNLQIYGKLYEGVIAITPRYSLWTYNSKKVSASLKKICQKGPPQNQVVIIGVNIKLWRWFGVWYLSKEMTNYLHKTKQLP